jgi:hypothetical protein
MRYRVLTVGIDVELEASLFQDNQPPEVVFVR